MRTKTSNPKVLFAVLRRDLREPENPPRFMVYADPGSARGITWTTSLAKASRWNSAMAAANAKSVALQWYDIPHSSLRVVEV